MGDIKKHISMREGSVFVDGVKILEAVSCQIIGTPDVWEGRSLGERAKNRRWMGVDYKVNIKEFKSTPWIKETIKRYQKNGETPEFTIQGIQADETSDYYEKYGQEVITASGCVITSDMILLDLDTEGEMVRNEIEMGAKYINL